MRTCQHCGVPLPDKAPPQQKYCAHEPECQAARKRQNQQAHKRYVAEAPEPEPGLCPICSLRPRKFSHGELRVTCGHKDCLNEIKRRNNGKRAKVIKEGWKLTNCLGSGCNAVFLSPVSPRDPLKRALIHKCPACRHREEGAELRFVECYGGRP